MTCTNVNTQAEFDAAAARGDCAHVSGSATVHASGSATVRAYDSATVRASGSATVRASGSATVRAYDSATVRAYDSATVRAYDSATVRAYDSATVRASGSATVHASGSATVHAYDSAQVRAHDRAKIDAGRYVAVTCHGSRIDLTGGVRIDVPELDTAEAFLDFYGVQAADGKAVLYKGVNDALTSSWGVAYPVGEVVTAPDWTPQPVCGGGLHLCARPVHTRRYASAERYLAVEVDVADIVPIRDGGTVDKVKVRSCRVLHEVDVDGERIAAEVSA